MNIPSKKDFAKDGKFPAVILITGSGAQNRDEEIFGHKPFLVISDFLTKLGFVVLRMDDRGVAVDSKIISNSDTFDFVSDAICQINYLKSLNFVNSSKIGVLGHSEGGLISFILASDYPQDISFIISLAGPCLRGDKLLLLQQEAIARASGIIDIKMDENIYCPSLILFGEKDLQVPAKQNFESINSITTQTNQNNLKIFIVPSANHLFQKANTGNIFEYALINETILAETLNNIKEFLINILF